MNRSGTIFVLLQRFQSNIHLKSYKFVNEEISVLHLVVWDGKKRK